ncbi:hypothetical protein GGI25_003877 [Coemansia spiralis]|uniref:Uncharacterized protein n=2 Tax=Coemansia TaxID=4863 RepID=A0A9W8G196_9FUNG|nr:hypothetical protein BX070DRAFT_255676 [Coemansia spiralis]KAJ1991076.1 hypothetical protein EDC05_003678 [Coemansia umbellata]KAJ2621112.1 hypothetical protein GGI26_004374 [Coemansia sp. RSA 1358]KAJ2675679.1 hypothetical protein GGI25_003877 [Coemansia spiralis]
MLVTKRLSNPIKYSHLRRLSNIKKQILRESSSFDQKLVETYPEPTSTMYIVDYDELRETVKSIWRKRQPDDKIKIVAFVVPKGNEAAIDFAILHNSNYQQVLDTISLAENTFVFYELEDGYSAPPSSPTVQIANNNLDIGTCNDMYENNAVFNEFIVSAFPEDPESTCAVKLNSLLFV